MDDTQFKIFSEKAELRQSRLTLLFGLIATNAFIISTYFIALPVDLYEIVDRIVPIICIAASGLIVASACIAYGLLTFEIGKRKEDDRYKKKHEKPKHKDYKSPWIFQKKPYKCISGTIGVIELVFRIVSIILTFIGLAIILKLMITDC